MTSINFQNELALKGIEVSDLPKSQQKKIEDFLKLKERVEEIEQDVDDDSRQEFEQIKAELEAADNEISEYIRTVDMDKLNKQRELVKQMIKRKMELKAAKESGGVVPPFQKAVSAKPAEPAPAPEPEPTPEPVAPKVEQPAPAAPAEEVKAPVPQEKPVAPVRENEQTIGEHLQELKREAQVRPDVFDEEQEQPEPSYEQQEVVEVEAEEEFQKQGERKPRKVNLPLVVMGVGALLLTWGAVNFFKERR